jgi:hypothetical protein
MASKLGTYSSGEPNNAASSLTREYWTRLKCTPGTSIQTNFA